MVAMPFVSEPEVRPGVLHSCSGPLDFLRAVIHNVPMNVSLKFEMVHTIDWLREVLEAREESRLEYLFARAVIESCFRSSPEHPGVYSVLLARFRSFDRRKQELSISDAPLLLACLESHAQKFTLIRRQRTLVHRAVHIAEAIDCDGPTAQSPDKEVVYSVFTQILAGGRIGSIRMRRAALLVAALLVAAWLAAPSFAEPPALLVTEEITLTCGSPCADEPETVWDKPSCDEYDLNAALIEALDHGDRSALALLQRRHDTATTYDERHRIAAALLRRVDDDSRYWSELAEHAENAIRFAPVDEKYTAEFQDWCEQRGWNPDTYWYLALRTFILAADDRRSRPLLLRAIATDHVDLVSMAIGGFAAQHDETMLSLIEKAITRLSGHESRLAFDLFVYGTEAADALARRFLGESDREIYEQDRAAR